MEIGSCITTGEDSRLGKLRKKKRRDCRLAFSKVLSAPTPHHLFFLSPCLFSLIPPLNLMLPLNIPFLVNNLQSFIPFVVQTHFSKSQPLGP